MGQSHGIPVTTQKAAGIAETRRLRQRSIRQAELNEWMSFRSQQEHRVNNLNVEGRLAEQSAKSTMGVCQRCQPNNQKLPDIPKLVEDLVNEKFEKIDLDRNNQMDKNKNNNRISRRVESDRENYNNPYRNKSNSKTGWNEENFKEDKQKCQPNYSNKVKPEQTSAKKYYKINRLRKAKRNKKYQDLLGLQSNIYINGTTYHYEVKLVPNNNSLPHDNGIDPTSNNITVKKNSNDRQFKDDLQNKFITKNFLTDYENNETGKTIQKIANDFIKHTEQMHNYKTFYSRMPLHRYSRVAYGNRDERIMLRTMDLEESNEIRDDINYDYLTRQTIAYYDN
ncbi:hypothetical protein SNEBB_000226 [Seison nebaliae]|nr:hypothetical protein SNEBB_000226 [Seison nebaliae]